MLFRSWLTGFIILGALALSPRANITRIDNDLTAWFSTSDPIYRDYERFRDEFGGTRTLIVALEAMLDAAGAVPVEDDAADALRIEAGLPRFGPDMAEDTIPLEAGIEARAISFNKGCYVGQEVIIRVLHRGGGRVAQKLVGLRWPAGAQVPPSGTVLRSGGADIGSVTSSAYSPACGCAVALAYLKRDFIEPGTVVSDGNGTAVDVVALPFASRQA